MANKSRLIISENDNNHASRLVKSFQSIKNLEDYKAAPKGVWGSTAKITISLNPYVVTLNSSELDFEFYVPFDDDLEANEGEIVVYNLSDNTIKTLQNMIKNRTGKIKELLVIEAGYEGDAGVIFKGYMTKISTARDGTDRVTTIKIIDDLEAKENLEESFSGRASELLKQLVYRLKEKTGLTVGKILVKSDYTYDNLTLDKPLESAIKEVAEVCGVSVIIRKKTIYCCELKNIDDTTVFDVSEDTGMIGSPSPFAEEITIGEKTQTVEGFDIDLLLQHRLSTGSVIGLKSEQYNGTYYVKSGEHSFDGLEAVTKIRVI